MSDTIATHRAQMPAGTERFLNARSLASANRRLAEILTPGMSVLDVGCGTGAITEGIAEAVGPNGKVLGIDISRDLIDYAREREARHPNLTFELTDVGSLGKDRHFDLVTSARMLQWLADPLRALQAMVAATRPGGRLLVLDYNHHKTRWEPIPPKSVQNFLAAFLQWRAQAGMDNAMSDHLEGMLLELGLQQVRCVPQPEETRRGDEDFEVRIALWGEVIATRGHQIVADGFLTETERAAAQSDFEQWAKEAQSQTLWLAATEGTIPE
jgi:ubiquinone/menaquinone biosynthesis C-methylase UbiE